MAAKGKVRMLKVAASALQSGSEQRRTMETKREAEESRQQGAVRMKKKKERIKKSEKKRLRGASLTGTGIPKSKARVFDNDSNGSYKAFNFLKGESQHEAALYSAVQARSF